MTNAETPENRSPEHQSVPERTVDRRVEEVHAALADPALGALKLEQPQLYSDLVEQIRIGGEIEEAVARGLKADYQTAMVVQFHDLALSKEGDATFLEAYLKAFDAHASLKGVQGHEITAPVTAGFLSKLAGDTRLPKQADAEDIDTAIGAHLATAPNGEVRYLVVDTKYEGVKLVFDGPAVTDPDKYPGSQVRPMIAISLKPAEKDPSAA